MMHAVPYLTFNSQCREAFAYYEKHLGAEILSIMGYEDTPMAEEAPPANPDDVMHGAIKIGSSTLLASDAFNGGYVAPAGVFVAIQIADKAEGERMFNALADGGEVIMPFEKTFWAEGFGMACDKFGVRWMVNCDPSVEA